MESVFKENLASGESLVFFPRGRERLLPRRGFFSLAARGAGNHTKRPVPFGDEVDKERSKWVRRLIFYSFTHPCIFTREHRGGDTGFFVFLFQKESKIGGTST